MNQRTVLVLSVDLDRVDQRMIPKMTLEVLLEVILGVILEVILSKMITTKETDGVIQSKGIFVVIQWTTTIPDFSIQLQ